MKVAVCAALAVVAAATLVGVASPASAAPGAEIGIADDRILFGDPAQAAQIAEQWKADGMQAVRIHARWVAIAPGPGDVRPPDGFNAADHNDPRYNWANLDRVVALLHGLGIDPVLTITGSGPLWASRAPWRANPRYKPDPQRFADFAYAVASRYRDQVDSYIVWNEPNQPGWLQPQFSCVRRRCTPVSPHVYRALLTAATAAIKAADPGAEILIGALAPRGGRPIRRNIAMRPLPFIRALGCVNDRYRPVRTGPCRGFHPAWADGFAYHPHGVRRSPFTPNPNPDEAAMADLPRLELALDRVVAARGLRTHAGTRLGLYLTEFGYQTRPPDPYAGVAPALQARWLQQAAYLAWRDPRVKCLMQYVWRDEPLRPRDLGPKAFAGWQSGLMYADGRPKPALSVFRKPFWINITPGRALALFWGQVRPSGAHTVTLLGRSGNGRPWIRITEVGTDANGYWTMRLPIYRSGQFRYTFEVPSGDPYLGPVTERSAILHVRARVGVLAPR